MESWLYKQGEQKGVERSAARSLRALFVRRLGREPGADEEQALLRHAQDVSPEQLVEVVEMPADVFLAWLGASGTWLRRVRHRHPHRPSRFHEERSRKDAVIGQ